MNMRRGSQKFDDSKHKRNKQTGQFTKMANSGPPSAAAAHQVDLTAAPVGGATPSPGPTDEERRQDVAEPSLGGRTMDRFKLMGRTMANPRAAWHARQDRLFVRRARRREIELKADRLEALLKAPPSESPGAQRPDTP